ncbi:hypothetical protein J4Q44_G00176410 [Coregonus suidteri]|uniref:Uncharacterized protein n=1 Tax=Coregonus suidteri TaxID=861788 RepID=A0AAN8R3X1_9TELE
MKRAQSKTLKTSTEPTTDPNTEHSTASCPGTLINQGIKKRAIILTKDEKNMAALERTCQAFRSNQAEYERFLDHMTLWLQEHQDQAVELFSLCDTDSTEWRVRMRERRMLFPVVWRSVERSYSPALTVSPPPPETNRFILLSIRLIPFDYGGAHPVSFEVVLPSRTRVSSLIRVIEEWIGIQTTSLQVFRTRVPSQESFLPPDISLGECGFSGGPEDSPSQASLFYDYRLEFTDCPILNCDHYFDCKQPQIGEDYFASRPI